jgi:BlaR1 peptidase M56
VPVGTSLLILRSIRRRGQPWPEGMARMNELAQAAGMGPPAVLLHDGIAGPITSGILRPVIVLPADAVKWNQTHVANALIHELAHVRRRDWPVHLVSRTACALYWFHPLAWMGWRALRLEAERACDDAVLAREDAATYAEQLLGLARHLAHRPAPGLSMASSSDLSTRIRSVLDNMRPRGRAGKVMIMCTALAAVVAVAVLAPLRLSESGETRQRRAAELLAKRTDADSLAAAGLLGAGKHSDLSLRLIAQASLVAPERADLVWLHMQYCQANASCDPEPLEKRLRSLDEQNGAGWFGALVRASKRGDEEAKSATLAAIARSGRVDIYWTTLIAHLSRAAASTKAVSLQEAMVDVIGVLAAQALPAYTDVSKSCNGERLTRDDGVEVCRGIANSLMNGDTLITEMIGISVAKRAWLENSPKWVEAAEAQRIGHSRLQLMGDSEVWLRAHATDYLHLLEQHRREQDVMKAVLIAMGKNPNPP